MIHDVDETIRQLLVGELAKIPERGALSDLKILFDTPAAAGAGKTASSRTVNMYLHDIRENLKRRDEFFRVNRHPEDKNLAGRSRAPINLDLAYLVSTEAQSGAADAHQLLSDVLGVLLRCDDVPAEYYQGSLVSQDPGAVTLTVATADHPAHADLTALWRSLGLPVRPAITLVASIKFNPFETRWTRVVREAIVAMQPSADPAKRGEFVINGQRVSAAGVVTAAGKHLPLPDVNVHVANTEYTVVTDAQGIFFLANLPPGHHRLQLSLHGYHPAEQSILVQPSGRTESLDPLVIGLEPLTADEWQQSATEAAGTTLVDAGRHARVTIAGRLTFPDGRPAAYIPLRLGSRKTVTDHAGFYLFSDIPFTHEEIVAELPGCGEIPLQTTKGGDSVVSSPPAGASGPKKPVKA
ncbi:MAG: Pvc16 family protein [Armatimonadota bacterium]